MSKLDVSSIVCSALKIAILAAIITGCTYSHTGQTVRQGLRHVGWSDDHQILRNRVFTLPAGASVYFAYPSSSPRLDSSIPRFRSQLQQALLATSRSRGLKGVVGHYQDTFDQALDHAHIKECDFLLAIAVIELQQESGVPERKKRFQFAVDLYDVRSRSFLGNLLVITERGRSPSYGDDELLYGSVETVIDQLYVLR